MTVTRITRSWWGSSLRILAFHTEQLHHNRIWQRVVRLASWMARHKIKATFFVYPFRAQIAGKDIKERIKTLVTLEHEIGQHTHFYAGVEIDPPDKINDFSDANIVNCLRRDFQYLRSIGYYPKGFTAGSWIVNNTVLDTLLELGFTYDCSARFPKPLGMSDFPYNRWQTKPLVYTNTTGRLLCLPTSYNLGEWFKWGRKIKTYGPTPYRLVYLHDYDLLSSSKYFLLWYWCFLGLTGRDPSVPICMLAKKLLAEEGI